MKLNFGCILRANMKDSITYSLQFLLFTYAYSTPRKRGRLDL